MPTIYSSRGRVISSHEHSTPQETLSFEQALARLNTLVQKLESGQLPLEESVAAFEQGVKLSRHCEALLDQAEQRLAVLDADAGNDAATHDKHAD